jgi:hypothetical protein
MVVISPKDIAASGWLFTLCNYRDLCREASSSSTVPLKQDGTVLPVGGIGTTDRAI